MRYDPGEAFRSIVESREKNSFTLYTWISSFAVRKPIREKFFLSLYIYIVSSYSKLLYRIIDPSFIEFIEKQGGYNFDKSDSWLAREESKMTAC